MLSTVADWRRAHMLARLSVAIYDPPENFTATALDGGGRVLRWVDHRGTQVAHVSFPDWEAIIFRGTEVTGDAGVREKVRDFRFNLRQWPTAWSGEGKVHSGYLAALGRVRYQAGAMLEHAHDGAPLYISGHSLGGALATLWAATVAHHRLDGAPLRLVTFGAPKVATREAFEPLLSLPGAQILRFTVSGDLAPIWPLSLSLAHPAPSIDLDPPGFFWSRHAPETYEAAIARDLDVMTAPAF